ncbi:MAG: DUF2071 domain-containing protein [Bryobacterales bacterium]|nr:DUF2071 domain-containing protein [Bryobacterales bacterium]
MKLPVDHRPWPLPSRPWAMSMVWRDLAFLHWPVKAEALRPLVPPGLSIDTLDGSAWLGAVPFAMEAVCPRFTPRIPSISDFPELNLRTYVTCEGKPGVFFFSLDAASWLGVRMARRFFHLPYFDARIRCQQTSNGIDYESERTHKRAPHAKFQASYRAIGAPSQSSPGSAEHWLTERYCLYAASPDGRLFRGDIHHAPWSLQRAECDIRTNGLGEQIGVPLTGPPVFAHFAASLYVKAWLITPVGSLR